MKSIIKGAGYILAHAPDMVIHNGTTQTTERIVNPDSEYLKELPKHLRSFDQVLSYQPNQIYIGNLHPETLQDTPLPWYDKPCDLKTREGKMGHIMPQEEFLLLMQACDVFDLVKLDETFLNSHKAAFENNDLIDESIVARLGGVTPPDEIARLVSEEHSEGLYHEGNLVGCVIRAHDIDPNLSAHVIHENLVSKASAVLSLLSVIANTGVSKDSVDYVIDCSEEACGDMNQRGGGNFAKSAAEIAGLVNATGSDTRGFCAAPTHALIEAAALVASGAFSTVVVAAGGCTAKLGMNGKDHVKKGLPILEDMLAGFAVVITKDDGVSPQINLELLGRHTVGTGSAPQAVISSLVTAPLDRHGLTILDIEKYSVEMQNPDITKPAGAGDVPEANYKMIAALAVKRGEMEKADLMKFVKTHGMMGWAPTQGHIPSGVPYVGFAREDILAGKIKNAMIIGKGSLFLGRMTNLFDGVSFVIQANDGGGSEHGVSQEAVRGMIAQALKDFANSLLGEGEVTP
ncbi:MAG: glycine/sarcosine/betaine reductase complex component C subunit beta [Eubacteriales bacterium]